MSDLAGGAHTNGVAHRSTLTSGEPPLVVDVDDRSLTLTFGDESHTLPVGPASLCDGVLAEVDPPAPEDLTNALGLVHDHLDDLLMAAPWFADVTPVLVRGVHAHVLARVEIGSDEVPAGYVLTRAAADEVFRTVALEPVEHRRHNPGLPASHVESIVATCCVILAVMRRFELAEVIVAGPATSPGGT